MDVPHEIDDYVKRSIDHAVGLPVDLRTMEMKFRAMEEARMRYREQYCKIGLWLKEKDEIIERTRFANEADARAKEAESKVRDLEDELGRVLNELQCLKAREPETQELELRHDNISREAQDVAIYITDEIGSLARTFLEANRKHERFNVLHGMWSRLKPATRMAISLIAEMKRLEKDKEHLRINLQRTESEARLLAEENNILGEENKRLLNQMKEIRHSASGGKHSCSGTTKGQKRKSSPRTCSSIDIIDFGNEEVGRYPPSPLLHNSPHTRIVKK